MDKFEKDEEMGMIYNPGASTWEQKRYGEYFDGEKEDLDEANAKIYNPNSTVIDQARYGHPEQKE